MSLLSRQRILGLMSVVFATATAVVRLHAEVISAEQLFEKGRLAAARRDYAEVLMYFFAYVQRAPPALQQSASHAEQVEANIRFAKEQLKDIEAQKRRLEARVASLSEPGEDVAGARGDSTTVRPPRLDDPVTLTATPPTSPLVCRGGGGMSIQLATQGLGVVGTRFVIGFRRAAMAGRESLAAGECAWLDRTVNPDEPTAICHPVEAAAVQLAWSVADGAVQRLTSVSAPYLSHLAASETTTFNVYNNGGGCLVAARMPYGTRTMLPVRPR